MPQSTPESHKCNSHDLVAQLAEKVSDLEETVDSQQETINDLEETVDSQQETINDLQEELESEADKRSADLEGVHNRINRIEADSKEKTPTPEATEVGSLTPIEQLSQADEVSDVTDSPTVQRAVSLFTNLPQWGSKTPKGIVLKPADNPLSLLEADRDESLAWKQYYRAAEALEQLSEGSVTFFDSDRHGKMLVLHKQSDAYERVVNGSLTESLVKVEG